MGKITVNYLAHLRLAEDTAQSRTGNIMGDFRKFLNGQELPGEVYAGIENHQRVDRFTDNHPLVLESKTLFSSRRRRFAGIMLDVVFDHFLIRYWNDYYEDRPEEFIQQSYADLRSMRNIMPPRMKHVVSMMSDHDWLGSYRHLENVGRALDGISSRIRFENTFSGALEELEKHYLQLETNFQGFYPELVAHIEESRIASGEKAR